MMGVEVGKQGVGSGHIILFNISPTSHAWSPVLGAWDAGGLWLWSSSQASKCCGGVTMLMTPTFWSMKTSIVSSIASLLSMQTFCLFWFLSCMGVTYLVSNGWWPSPKSSKIEMMFVGWEKQLEEMVEIMSASLMNTASFSPKLHSLEILGCCWIPRQQQ